MRYKRITLLVLLLLMGLAACSPGHVGGNEIAFVRDGHIWTIDPDGTNAYEIVAQDTPVIGYGWSPNHHMLVFRTLDADFAKTAAAKSLSSNAITQLVGDVPSTLNTVSIDGGSPIPIINSDPSIQQSNAWWNAAGNRLLYREESTSPPADPGSVLWWMSQDDQPNGIARKLLPDSFSIPSIRDDNSLAIGNLTGGMFSTTLTGTDQRYITRGTLPGHPLSATLERVLWQPAHQNPAILYAIVPTAQAFGTSPAQVQLLLRTADGQTRMLASCACTQFAWSPDGNHILSSTGPSYSVLNLDGSSLYTFPAETGSVPYWSPDGQFLLLDGLHTLVLVKPASKLSRVLLSDGSQSTAAGTSPSTTSSINALLQPASNSPWAADSRHFLFLTQGRMLWQGKALSAGKGLYTVTIDTQGKTQGAPSQVDNGNDTQAGWTYEPPATSFLF